MKKILLISLLAYSPFNYAEDVEGSSVTETTKSVVMNIVKFGKDLLEGADEGVDEGRKVGQSQDGAIIVDNNADFEKQLSVKLIEVQEVDENSSYVELGFKNATDNPVRLINLRESETIIAIDNEGYATNLAGGLINPMEVTVPSNAGKKQKFYFNISAASVNEIRIMGKAVLR